MAIGAIGGGIGSPIGGVIGDGAVISDAVGAANFDFSSAGAGNAIVPSPGTASFEIVADGGGGSLNDIVGAANFDFSGAGNGTGLLDGAGDANLDFAADAFGTDVQSGVGAADLDFIASCIAAYSRRPIRVVINQKNGPISRTAIGGNTAIANLGARRSASLLGTQVVYDTTFRAAGTRIGGVRSHTEVTNG